jgi:uncharacterized damage-inducible protein DinB
MEELQDVGKVFIQQAREHLMEDFLPKIRQCLGVLDEGDLWWRAHENNNSVGNLMLHLCGNVRQWIVAGVGGAPDLRERSKEFSERNAIPKKDLLLKLEETVTQADQVLSSLSPFHLLEQRTIQGFRRTVLQAIFHVVEHFSFHTGQIIYITKLRRGIDLGFYNL